MVNGRQRYYGNKKGATVPIMSRVSIETYQELLNLSEQTGMCLNQINVMLVEYALGNARLEEYMAYRIKFPETSSTEAAN